MSSGPPTGEQRCSRTYCCRSGFRFPLATGACPVTRLSRRRPQSEVFAGILNSNVYSGAQTGESERLLFAQSYYRMLVGFECPAGGALGNRPSVS